MKKQCERTLGTGNITLCELCVNKLCKDRSDVPHTIKDRSDVPNTITFMSTVSFSDIQQYYS